MKWGQNMPRSLEDKGRYQEGNFSGSFTSFLDDTLGCPCVLICNTGLSKPLATGWL